MQNQSKDQEYSSRRNMYMEINIGSPGLQAMETSENKYRAELKTQEHKTKKFSL